MMNAVKTYLLCYLDGYLETGRPRPVSYGLWSSRLHLGLRHYVKTPISVLSRLVVLFFCVLVFSQNVPAAEPTDLTPAKRYLLAYQSLSTAEWLAKQEMNDDAVEIYNESLRLFQQLASDYPTWQTNLVAFRINYCREGLARTMELKKTDPGRSKAVHEPARPVSAPDALPPRQSMSRVEADAGTTLLKAGALEGTSDFKGALEIYKTILAREKQNPTALSGAGRCLLKLGMIDEARDLLFQWSVVPSPNNDINLLMGLILCHDRQFAKAIPLLEIVVKDDSANVAARVALGVALAGTGQTREAISEMQKAISINPTLKEAHFDMAWLILKKDAKQAATANAYYQNALKFGAVPDPVLAKRLRK